MIQYCVRGKVASTSQYSGQCSEVTKKTGIVKLVMCHV
jgi:hypothetical protein